MRGIIVLLNSTSVQLLGIGKRLPFIGCHMLLLAEQKGRFISTPTKHKQHPNSHTFLAFS